MVNARRAEQDNSCMGDEPDFPLDKPLNFRGFLWIVVKSIPRAFREAGDLTSFFLFVGGAIVLAFNRQIAEGIFKAYLNRTGCGMLNEDGSAARWSWRDLEEQ